MLKEKFMLSITKQISVEIATLESNKSSREQASKTVELDQSSTGRLTRMDAMQQQAMAQENQRRAILRTKQLHLALLRIENEEYGYCVECDKEIFSGRLKANPITTLCINCAEEKERF